MNVSGFRKSKYVKMPKKLLFYTLRLQLNFPFKKGKERRFILERLKLFDEQYIIKMYLYLYQTWFDEGTRNNYWPVCTFSKDTCMSLLSTFFSLGCHFELDKTR